MFANYHTHTYRCNHATGTEEEYIQNAISLGFTELGFSDHIPLAFEDGFESGYRVSKALASDYISTIKALKEKYKDKIKIHIGFESEYYPDYFDEMLEYAKNMGAEFLILGQHFINNERDSLPSSCGGAHSEEELVLYTDRVIAAMKTGNFSYVAHPDMLLFNGKDEIYRREALRLCNAAKELDVPLEVNFLGILKNRNYPKAEFMKIAGEVGCKMIFGIDAHSEDWSYFDRVLKKAEGFVKEYNLNLINNLKLRPL